MEKTIAQEALEILEPIPHDQWTTDMYHNEDQTQCCAIGHFNRAKSGKPDYSEAEALLREKSYKFLTASGIIIPTKYATIDIVSVNDDDFIKGYNEDNPKDRVIHLLKDMVEAGY